MKKSIKLLICIISVVTVMIVALNTLTIKSLATDDEFDNLLSGNNTDFDENILEEFDDEDLDDDDDFNLSSGNNTNNNANNNTNNNAYTGNENTGMPYTGIEDNAVIFVIIACGISAIFAYKKIRDYKNI